MSAALRPSESTDALRRAFDQSFAEPRGGLLEALDGFLAIRIVGDPYAVRLSETAGLLADRKIVAVPSATPDLLGIAAFRGTVCPVFDLGALLGYPPAPPGRWLLQVGELEVFALAFQELDGHFRAARNVIALRETSQPGRAHVREVVRTGETIRSIVDIGSVIGAITRRAGSRRRAEGASSNCW